MLPIVDEPRFTTKHSLPGCVWKTLDYLGNVAVEPFTAAFNWRGRQYERTFTPPKDVVISDNLFRQYDCLDYDCSRCCWKGRFWNVSPSRIPPDEFSGSNG